MLRGTDPSAPRSAPSSPMACLGMVIRQRCVTHGYAGKLGFAVPPQCVVCISQTRLGTPSTGLLVFGIVATRLCGASPVSHPPYHPYLPPSPRAPMSPRLPRGVGTSTRRRQPHSSPSPGCCPRCVLCVGSVLV
jgi:hypothetical protein